MRRFPIPTRLPLAGILLGAVGCAEAPDPPMLHALPAYAGEVAIAGLDGAAGAARYELSFARQNGYFAAKFETDGRVITLLAGAHGALEVFEDTRVRPATPGEQARFALVRDLTDPKAVERFEARLDHYRVWRAGKGYTVRLQAVATGFHRAHGGDGTGGTARGK